MRHVKKIIVLAFMLLLAACASEPVEVTREVVIEQEVEVTRVVEVTNEVEVVKEVEVTRLVEVEKEVEVTRIVEVEVEVTAVPSETPVPTPTNTPAPQPVNTEPQPTHTPEISLQDELLASMLQTRINIDAYGGMIDGALRSGYIDCQDIVNTYDAVVNAPTYDVTNANDLVKNAYPAYRSAIDVFSNGARDMSENCRSWLADPSQGGGIDRQQWGLARLEVGTAVSIIQPAILSLGGE